MIATFTAAVGILDVTAIPETQAPGQQPADRPTTQPPTEANKVTISGCVKSGAAADSFILWNAVTTPAAPGRDAPPTTGTAGSTKSYNIVAKPGEELSKHLNHRIEVTGTLGASRPPSAALSATAPPAADQPTETATAQSLKMIAMACP
jgi:hypothetical protein